MIKKIKIPKSILIVCCLLTSILSINKLDALTYKTYFGRNGVYNEPGSVVNVTKDFEYSSLVYVEDSGNYDYYVDGKVKLCSSVGSPVLINDSEQITLVKQEVFDKGSCNVGSSSGSLYEIVYTYYLPIQTSGKGLSRVSFKFNSSGSVKYLSTDANIILASTYELNKSNEALTSCSENIFNASSWKSNSFISTSVSSNNIHGNGNAWATILYSYENLDVGDYTVHYSSNVLAGVMYYSFDNSTFTYLKPDIYHTLSVKGKLYIRLQVSSKSEVDFTKLMLAKGNVSSFIEYGKQSCSNKLDDMNDKQQKTNEKLDDLNSKLTDTSAPDTSGFGNVSGWLPAGPVDSILTLPLKVMNTISGVLSGSCSPITLPLPFIDSNLDLPCGDTFYDGVTGLSVFLNTLGLIVGGYLLYCYLIYLYNWVDKKVSMVENDREKWGVV